ncbi:valine--tRNA ligase, chloroplastic/mitochondrial 2 isoform X1 [Tanacetum coccineum]
MLSLRERMELDLEARLMGETLVLNRSLDPFLEDYIELNDLNEPFEHRRNQGDDLMPTIEEGEPTILGDLTAKGALLLESFIKLQRKGYLSRYNFHDLNFLHFEYDITCLLNKGQLGPKLTDCKSSDLGALYIQNIVVAEVQRRKISKYNWKSLGHCSNDIWARHVPQILPTRSLRLSKALEQLETGEITIMADEMIVIEEIYQDPDVLDTWFSSCLWPFSTLGWPDVSADDYKRFYPTSVLETGHDILFFWVARMVMMGIEFTGTVPFTHVYLHGLIRDSQGRKMSKTLGNVIDPLDTVKEFSIDALWFTLSLGTVGQDLNLSTERVTSNKAFTNKLWNASKFVLQNLPDRSDASAWETLLAHKEERLLGLPLPEYWVVSKLHVLVDAVTTSYDKYFYNDVAREMYDFFWGDFADWYIEASKAHLYQSEDQALASTSQAVLLYVYENILKMLHPFMPFVTEELWQALPNRKEALIVSPWPLTSLPRNLTTIKRFENLQALTRAIRNVRAEYSVEPAKRISASIVANTEVIQYISVKRKGCIGLSVPDLNCKASFLPESLQVIDPCAWMQKQFVHLVAGEGLEAYLPLADLADISAEVQRLSKRLSKMQKEYDGLMVRLSSRNFVEKAPADVVRGVREKAAEAEEKLNLTETRLSFLQSTVTVRE